MLSITIQTDTPHPLVTPVGKLDSTTCNEFDQAIKPLIDQFNCLIINLAGCNYLSSAGIRILLLSEKKLLAKGGGLFLSGVKPEVFQILEMAGLHQVFRLFESPDAARMEIDRKLIKSRGNCEWSDGNFSFQFHQIGIERNAALLWKDQGIAGYNELDVAIGTGWPCENHSELEQSEGLFISDGRCSGFVPLDAEFPSDFRIPQNPARAGVFTGQVITFGKSPTGMVRLTELSSILPGQLAQGLHQMKSLLSSGNNDLLAAVIADYNPEFPSIMIGLIIDRELVSTLRHSGLDDLSGFINDGGSGARLWGARFILDKAPSVPTDISLLKFLENTLTIENIIDVGIIESSKPLVNPICWMFLSQGAADASSSRLQIEKEGDFLFEPHKAFLTRRLYTDSARLIVKPLHGGYSAQTFQVASFDSKGRKLRPTVLKIGNRAMITRESDRCQQYALPFILNNSAIVLGTEFFGDTGALRYNFVGIGGEQTQLKWLAYYFHHWPLNQLEPLFDKIFLQILKPWYGQPVQETIYPFREHDPRLTFFPQLCQTAEQLFSISSGNQFLTIEETGRKIINPYWFLQQEYARLNDTGIEYFTAICHGDLNMQNILLDEDMNVYLIDFSETKPRSLISDFARLEAIFIVEHAPVENDKDMEEYVLFLTRFYGTVQLDEAPKINYHGAHPDIIERITALILKMRSYALVGVNGDPNPVPYCMALLEWILPVVCYSSAPLNHQRLSMIASGLLCEQVTRSLQLQYPDDELE